MPSFTDTVLARRPLSSEEKLASPSTICVTGAAGYIASSIICRLLAAGHTVHATHVEQDAPAAINAIKALPGAGERVKWFIADLAEPGSFDEAVKGCRFVIHTAAPTLADTYQKSIPPAIRGVLNVLEAVKKSKTVEKVVMTSSFAAVVGNYEERGAGHVYTESDWTLNFLNVYPMAKTLSEWAAWTIASQQQDWNLVTIVPAMVFGPPVSASPVLARLVIPLFKLPFLAPMGCNTVDVDDVAFAHVLAVFNPNANGRYILCEGSYSNIEAANWLRINYPEYRKSFSVLPYWVCRLAAVLPLANAFKMLTALYGKTAKLSSKKAQQDLGLQFLPFATTMKDMVSRFKELGIF